MARIDKKFVLSTSQLNSHKFRCLTEGADLTDFIANPIMYWLHQTPEGKGTDEPMPIGFWEDIKVEGDEITAYPNIDDSDPFALKIGKKIEHGTLRAASIEADPIELDTNKDNWLPGQKLPTLKKYRIGEASIVDRGSNKGAIAKLKHLGKSIKLSDQASADEIFKTLLNEENDTMKIKLNQKAAKALKLSADTELDATEVVDKLVEVIEGQEVTLKEKTDKITELEGAEKTNRIKLMLKTAEDEGKILAGEVPSLLKLAAVDEESVKTLLAGKAATKKLRDTLGDDAEDKGEVAELMKLSFDELHQSQGLTRLKEISPEGYKLKFKSKYGKLPS